jgi:hypothetical protein
MVSSTTFSAGAFIFILVAFNLAAGLLYPFWFWQRPFLKNLRRNAKVFDSEMVRTELLAEYMRLMKAQNPSFELTIEQLRKHNAFGDKIVCVHHLKKTAEDLVESARDRLFVMTMLSMAFLLVVFLQVVRMDTVIPSPFWTTISLLSPLGSIITLGYTALMHHEFRKQVRRYSDILSTSAEAISDQNLAQVA